MWTQRNWARPQKHWPPGGKKSWGDAVRETNTGNRWAKYKKVMSAQRQEEIETSVFGADGNFITEKNTERYFYVVCNKVIGASCGEETRIVKVKWTSDGTFHGQPYTEDELKRTLKRHNRAELDHYESEYG